MKTRLARVFTTCYSQGELHKVEVQVLIRNGLPRLDIIGLPQNTIKEGKDRIIAALSNLGVEIMTKRILVSLNPGHIPKEGSHFDLPILIAILQALELLPAAKNEAYFWGEIGLDGSIRQAPDALAHLLFSNGNLTESLVANFPSEILRFISVYLNQLPTQVESIHDILTSTEILSSQQTNPRPAPLSNDDIHSRWINEDIDRSIWNRLKGSQAQFTLFCILAIGRHHLLLEGPPGSGKSTWCNALNELQVPLQTFHWADRFRYNQGSSESVHSLNQLIAAPFECPHHTSSSAAIVGGGNASITKGALSRAHLGILFLDEFSEFNRDVIEALREPIENKTITIARSGCSMQLPADIQLLAAMNPCKCGYFLSKLRCQCSSNQLAAYRARVSGPIRDRFHIRASWKYEQQEANSEFKLSEVRQRLISAQSLNSIQMQHIQLPPHLSPRRRKLWFEVFVSWCKWFGISEPDSKDAHNFDHFINLMEDVYETNSIY